MEYFRFSDVSRTPLVPLFLPTSLRRVAKRVRLSFTSLLLVALLSVRGHALIVALRRVIM